MKKFIIYSPGRDNNSRFEPNKQDQDNIKEKQNYIANFITLL